MSHSRRYFVAASLAALVAGCGERTTDLTRRPGPDWPQQRRSRTRSRTRSRRVVKPPPAQRMHRPKPAQDPLRLSAIDRSQWSKAGPMPSRLDRMGSINRITVHHEGIKPRWFSDFGSTARHLELLRHSHVKSRRFGDIGYHYIIDRNGRIWEGRPIAYQGAHAGGANNRHNIGVMVLGNFDRQQPTGYQLSTLVDTIRKLQRQYRIPVSRVYTHQELSPTRCPGKTLQPRMVRFRRDGTLV